MSFISQSYPTIWSPNFCDLRFALACRCLIYHRTQYNLLMQFRLIICSPEATELTNVTLAQKLS